MALRYRIPGTHRRPLRPAAQTDVESPPAGQDIAINCNLPLAAFFQRLQMRGIQPDLLRQIGKALSIYDCSFVHFLKP